MENKRKLTTLQVVCVFILGAMFGTGLMAVIVQFSVQLSAVSLLIRILGPFLSCVASILGLIWTLRRCKIET